MEFTNNGQYLIAGIGQEHRLGRWWRIKESKNCVLIIPLLFK
jgi:ribosomal RNA-processing protein 9